MTLHATAPLAGYRGSLPTERIRLRVWDLFFRMQISAPDVIGIRVDIEMRLVRVHDGRLDHLVDLIEAFPQIPEHAGQVFLVFDVEAGLSLFVVDPLYPGPGPLRSVVRSHLAGPARKPHGHRGRHDIRSFGPGQGR